MWREWDARALQCDAGWFRTGCLRPSSSSHTCAQGAVAILVCLLAGLALPPAADPRPTIAAAPPLPRILSARVVSGTMFGRGLRTSYCFDSLRSSAAKPWRLYIMLDNPRDGFAPISIAWLVRKRCAVVVQPMGDVRSPYMMRYFVQSANDVRSPTRQMRPG